MQTGEGEGVEGWVMEDEDEGVAELDMMYGE